MANPGETRDGEGGTAGPDPGVPAAGQVPSWPAPGAAPWPPPGSPSWPPPAPPGNQPRPPPAPPGNQQWPPPAPPGNQQWPPPAPGGWDGRTQAPIPQPGQRFLDRPGAPPATRAAAGFWLFMAVLGFAIGEVVGTIFVVIAAFVAGQGDALGRLASMSEPPEWYIGTSLVGLWVGFFLGPFVASKARGTGRFFADLGVRFRPIDLVGVVIGIGGQLVLDALYAPFISHMKDFTAPTHKLVGASHGWGYLVIAILTVCGAPFFEEILFRGLAFKALARLFTPVQLGASRRRALGVAAAVVVDGLLFGLAHWEPYQFAGLAVFGMVLAYISYRTDRLGMNMVAHASFNLVAVLALLGTSGALIR